MQMEGARLRLETLHRQLARLPRTARGEYDTLVEELEGQVRGTAAKPADVRQLFDEIEAIAKCVDFELAAAPDPPCS
jgi:hypothetical protein